MSYILTYEHSFYDAMQDRRHINMLAEIITDELRHGNLYNFLYSKNKCYEEGVTKKENEKMV